MTEEMSLAVFDPFKALAVKVQAEDAALDLDHTTPDGETKLRSWVRTVRGYRAGLEKIRVRAKADALEYGRKVDGLAKELKVPFDTIITDRMKPLDDIEAAKRAEAEAKVEAERVAKEKAEADRVADLKRREAEVAAKEVKIKAAENVANAIQIKADRADREKRIAESAAQTAREEAEEKASDEAEAKVKERLADEATERLKTQQAAAAEKRRTENEAHRETVEQETYDFLGDLLGSDVDANLLLSAIKDARVPHVTINY